MQVQVQVLVQVQIQIQGSLHCASQKQERDAPVEMTAFLWGWQREAECGLQRLDAALDAVIVGAPGLDGFLDLLAGEVFGGGALGEGDYFGVGGEA